MYNTETMIVLTDYPSLVEEYGDKETRTRFEGIVCNPILNNGNYLLPLGWETELTNASIPYTVEDVEIYSEDFDERTEDIPIEE